MAREDGDVVLDYWFSEHMKPHWFNSNPTVDDELRERFENLFLQAKMGELKHWESTSTGLLALIILLDQIPLNIYRSQPESFATEAQAIVLSKKLIADKFLGDLDKSHQLFGLLPLIHSESLDDHDLAIKSATSVGWNDEDSCWFIHHRGIIEKYGRFPHRNAILGRESTAEELTYLASDDAFSG